MAIVTLYVLPMLLGRTYDVGKDVTGVDIFSKEDVANVLTINNYNANSRYALVGRSNEAKSFLDVSGSLSLKIKALGLKISGGGSYLRDTSKRSEMATENVTKTMHSRIKPLSDWRNFKTLGTHFCRSITYGGDLIASLVFKAEKEEDKEKIQAHVRGELRVGGTFDADIRGKLSKLQEDLKGTASMEINYYATVPVHGIPRTLKGLMDIVSNFPRHVKDINDGLGVPLTMELYPLSFLDTSFPPEPHNTILEPYMERLEVQLDDLLATEQSMADWLSKIPPLQPPKFLQSINRFKEKIQNIVEQFRQTISDLDISSSGRIEQFQSAFRLYQGDDSSLPDKYLRQFLRLKSRLETEYPEIRSDFGGAKYINWGQENCENPGVETSYSGVVATTEKDSFCLPSDNYLEDAKIARTKFTPIITDVKCSLCNAINRTVTFVQAGRKECPEGWTFEYEGVLVEAGTFLCMNGVENTEMAFKRVTASCGILPCDKYEGKRLNCVVCTK
ncbi:uncharacterized protein [Centruroides vittatus]|uniref:uncharacterized protein n=1 Tax=Centruroides vittatus TaxID=120091 RepID=UPI00351037F9